MKFGAIVIGGRGKIGGHVASANKAGAYLRTKTSPVNPSSGFQAGVRNRLTTISQSWRGLTQAQRNAWNGAVSQFQKTDIFGDLKNPSGFSLFVRLNTNVILLGGTLLTTPPHATALDQVSGCALTYTSGTPALSVASTVVSGTDHGYKVFATPPLQQGIQFAKNQLRLIGSGTSAVSGTFDILSLYTARFGAVGAVGSKIFVKIVPVGHGSGVEGTGVICSAIAAA